MQKTTITKKITATIIGLLLCLVVLEVGIRLVGFIFLSRQEYRNRAALRQKGAYRILCLGESMTAGEYPGPLEKALNERIKGIKFTVIDKARVRTNSEFVVSTLGENLDRYNPDMVIVMMGFNDRGDMLPYGNISIAEKIPFRVYRLARILWYHILNKSRPFLSDIKATQKLNDLAKKNLGRQQQGIKKERDKIPGPDVSSNVERVQGNINQERETLVLPSNFEEPAKRNNQFKEVVEIIPNNEKAYIELGRHYRHQGEYEKAEEVLKKAIEINPKNDKAYVELGWSYIDQTKYDKAEEILKKAIEINPENYEAYVELGRRYWRAYSPPLPELSEKAQNILKEVLEINPKSYPVYLELGVWYISQKKYDKAEEILKKHLKYHPKNEGAYIWLGWCYRKQGEYGKAEELLKEAIEIMPENEVIYGGLANCYKEWGKDELAEKYFRKADKLKAEYYSPVTRRNYQRLKEMVTKRGMRLVCMQYPVRSVKPLKRMFKNEEGIIFVDNERVFKEALEKASYDEYFFDMFGGDFGHCTAKGNRLIAENIVNTLLKEGVF